MSQPSPREPVLIQPVESPVICKPYYEPMHYYEYDRRTGCATKQAGRRPAAYWYKLPDQDSRGRGQQRLLELDEGRRELALVNKIREDVKRWRESNWEGATNVTKDLLRHWWRKDRVRRFFFCQMEAVETILFLNEIRGLRADGRRGKPRWNPQFTDADFEELHRFDNQPIESLPRVCCKMATGSGKTVVMGMLITWAFCNRGRVPSDDRFPNAALVCCPNLTIKERLQVLRPDTKGEDYYTQFDLVPTPYRDLLHMGKVLVTNWHAFAPESEHSEGGKSYRVVQKGEESDEAFAQNRLRELSDRGPLLVLNDEGHHAYRPAPISEKEAEVVGAEEKKEREEATIWVQGLDRIKNACGIKACVDLSATPFYIHGSGYPEGEPFSWIVSDFGLVDAIESGITKIPRLPVSDTTGRPDPKYFRLWKNVTEDLAPAQRLSNRRPKPEVVWERTQDALVQLMGEYKKSHEAIRKADDNALKAPPVLIVVCDNTDIAQVFFENISGQTDVEDVEDDSEDQDSAPQRRGKRMKTRVSFGASKTGFPDLFQNAPEGQFTIRIDSKRLEKVESEDPEATRDQAAQELREIVNTVGKVGKPGQDVRCVVSVSMLTEGWDANTVTHVLGVRAFGTQLLCEQVIGRALRRQSYELNEEGLFNIEYADVLGIPFDFTAKPVVAPPQPPRETIQVKAVRPARDHLEIRFPRVAGYRVELPEERLTAEFSDDSVLELTPDLVGPSITRSQGIIGEGVDLTLKHLEDMRRSTLLFHLTKRLVYTKWRDAGEEPKLNLFGQLKRITKEWLVHYLVCKGGTYPAQLIYQELADMACERITAGITRSFVGQSPIKAVLDPYNPTGSTLYVNFNTSRKDRWETDASRCHINWVILDSDWEAEFCRVAESHPQVKAYVKNHNLGLEVPYCYGSETRTYLPDFIVLVDDGHDDPLRLIVEIKGYRREDAKIKKETMETYWVPGVNNLGKYGRWAFAELTDFYQIQTDFEAVVKTAFNQMIEARVKSEG